MKIRAISACVLLAWTALLRAQDATVTTICLAKPGGAEAVNWNLRPSILRELSRKIADQSLNISALSLDAKSDKQSASEAAEKKCDLVVYSFVDRKSGDVSSMMNPSIYKRGTVNPDSSTGAFTLHHSFKLKDAKGKKIADDRVDVELQEGSGPKDYEDRGRTLVNSVSDKIIAEVTKQPAGAKEKGRLSPALCRS